MDKGYEELRASDTSLLTGVKQQPDYYKTVADALQAAFDAAREDRISESLHWFKLARKIAVTRCDQSRLDSAMRGSLQTLQNETEGFAQALHSHASPEAKNRIFIFSDSLGLPRAEEQNQANQGAHLTYAWKVQDHLNKTGVPGRVSAWCQRFATTSEVLGAMGGVQADLMGAHAIVHVGLNDAAMRIFLARERMALQLLPADLLDRFLLFARQYRRSLILSDPDYNYTPIDRFIRNLEIIVVRLRGYRVAKISFCTIIAPPVAFAKKTPHSLWNNTRYNLAISNMARMSAVNILELDRIIWESGVASTLRPDGMHLSEQGHQRVAEAIIEASV